MKTNLLIVAMLHFSFFSVGQTDSTKIHEYVEEYAEFPGGPAALKKYLAENINYPESTIKKKIEGTVYVRFVITDKGTVPNVRIPQAIPNCNECSEEVIRVFKGMRRWKPAKNNGKKVNSYYNSKVTFKRA